MTVDVTNNLTTIDAVNGTNPATNWSNGNETANDYAGFQREGTHCNGLGLTVSQNGGAGHDYTNITSASFASRTIFGWQINGSPDTETNSGFSMVIGDTNNLIAYSVGGIDNYGHFVNGWSGFKLDCANLPATFTALEGTEASLNTGAITRVGYGFVYSISAFGKIDNVFYDVISWIANGSAALTIAGGTSGAKGTFAQIVTEDIKTATGKAYGVIRTLVAGSKAYELSYGVEFGDTDAVDSYFEDSGFQLTIAGTGMTAGNLDVDLILGTATNRYFDISDGVIVGIGTVSNWDMSAAFSHMKWARITCTDLGTIAFPAAGTNRSVVNCIFNNCGQVSIGNDLVFTENTFNGTTNANGALLLDDATGEDGVSGLTFTRSGSGHAIQITQAGTYDLTDCVFVDYATSNGTTGNEVINNTSGGAVIINVSGGSGTVSYETSGGSVTVNNSVSFNLTNLIAGTTIYAEATSGGSLSAGTVMITAQVIAGTTFNTNLVANQPFKCLLAKADDEGGATDYEPILFEDTTGSGFSRRIEQIAE